MAASSEWLHRAADLLAEKSVADFVCGAIEDSRNKARRARDTDGEHLDRDSADVLTDVIAALRAA